MRTSNFLVPMKSAFISLLTIKSKCTSFEINGEAPGDDDEPIVVIPPKK